MFFIKTIGFLLAICPSRCVDILCRLLGLSFYYTFSKRRRTLLANIHHAFPSKTFKWKKQLAKTSCIRMVEMVTLLFASPFFTKDRIRRSFSQDKTAQLLAKNLLKSEEATLVLIPHVCLMEAIALYPALLDKKIEETGVFYRPFKNKKIDNWIKQTRERFGVTMLSRKQGFVKGLNLLRKKHTVGLLFDQNAGNKGTLSLFFDRIASTTEIHGLLAEKCNANILMLYPKRTGFWKGTVTGELLKCEKSKDSIIQAANSWLDQKLRDEKTLREDWLWTHSRWRCQDEPQKRLKLDSKKSILENYKSIPRKNSIFIRVPNWLGDVIMLLPLLRAIRESRPDAHITIIGQKHFFSLLEKFKLTEEYIPTPAKNWKYFLSFFIHRQQYPETQLLFTNSLRGDIEAYIIGAPQRFGIKWKGKSRPLLTHSWTVPKNIDPIRVHQTYVWEKFLKHFGLEENLNLAPFRLKLEPKEHFKTKPIGFICGTENSPEKRWPIHKWKELAHKCFEQNKDITILLFGTQRDRTTTKHVCDDFSYSEMLNLAGKTNLIEFAAELSQCRVVVCNDTGGMHLANALGIPVVAVFGPTNPIRTGPIFETPYTIIQPDRCPRTGGYDINLVRSADVFEAVKEYL